MREQFEKLPSISCILGRGVYFDQENNMYKGGSDEDYFWINGAWYAFQEQQNKLNGALDLACKLQYSNGERIYNEIKELLK